MPIFLFLAPEQNLMAQKPDIPTNKKIYFASDFHLGAPNDESSSQREQKIIRWLDHIKSDAYKIYLVGDIFDFWFEYKHAIPKGFVRFQAKLASLVEEGIQVTLFTGNHDIWMFDYFPKELGITVQTNPISLSFNKKKLYVGHGDGLGPGDGKYKALKKIFTNKFCQRSFSWLHPDIGIGFAKRWSRRSRISTSAAEEINYGDKEHLLIYCKEMEEKEHHDYYIFGHRHLLLDVKINSTSRYINLGEWVNHSYYAVFDGDDLSVLEYD